ncbi:MAG: YraN family protein [Burkholderiales bacterium]|nr:YraN family protein [Burkholderiales bacterium]
MPSRDTGEAAERHALDYLKQQGLKLVETNYRSRFGEIDLILRDGEVLVFAEVRMRKNNDFGGARASITAAKQARLIKTANQYLTQFARAPQCRFDAVLLGAPDSSEIEWIKNAFDER